MKNMMDIVKDVVSGNTLDLVSDLIGSDNASTTSALTKFAPAILGGLIGKGDSVSGAQSLLDIFKRNNYGDNNLSDLGGLLRNKEKSADFLNDGMGMLDMIFGKNYGSILDKVVNLSGLGRASGSTLMKFLAPVIINKLAGMVTKNGWGANKLMDYLLGQKKEVGSLVPGMSSLLGFAADEDRTRTTRTTHTTTTHRDNNSGGGMGWLKWLLPLLLLAGLWYFMKGCNNKEAVVEDTTKVEVMDKKVSKTETPAAPTRMEKTTTSTERVDADKTFVSNQVDYTMYKVVDNGDIIGKDGAVVYKGGTYALDGNGNLIDSNGRVLITSAGLPTSLVTSLKSKLGKYSGMKTFFSNMFKRKEITNAYLLNQIEFNKENHRITNFSKAEVEGLAAALKADKGSKIDVNVYTNDGKDGKENKELSKVRAEVVRDMLVTLGVDKGQIGFNGKGDSDERKAAADRVEITIKK